MSNLVLDQTMGFEVSEKYKQVKTRQIIESLTNQGFTVSSSVSTKVRKKEKDGFQKHMIRLAHPSLELKNVNDSRPEIVLVNSHDATTSLKLLIGVFRLVCSNGLIVGDTFGGVSITHKGDIWTKIDKGLKEVTERMPLVAQNIERMSQVILTDRQAFDLADQASRLILPDNAMNVNLSTMLKTRRQADQGTNLWTVFNKVQESAMRGGIKYQSETFDENGTRKINQNTSKVIKSIDRQVNINKDLWDLFTKAA